MCVGGVEGRVSVDGKSLRGKTDCGKGGFWLNRPNRIVAEGRPSDQTSPGGDGGRRA